MPDHRNAGRTILGSRDVPRDAGRYILYPKKNPTFQRGLCVSNDSVFLALRVSCGKRLLGVVSIRSAMYMLIHEHRKQAINDAGEPPESKFRF